MHDPFPAHEVLNQSPPFEDVNLYTSDVALMEAVVREGGGQAQRALVSFGLVAGSAEAFDLARKANANPPRLQTHDRTGRRIDLVEYHPAYHDLMRLSFGEGLNGSSFAHHLPQGAERANAHAERAAAFFIAAQMESGHCCPVTMTHAAAPVVLQNATLAADWLPLMVSRSYDPRFVPAAEKSAVTIGMGMTENQGGSDVRQIRTVAEETGDGAYRLMGQKWFLSAPMSDAFLVLAQASGGLSCFLMPRYLPDGRVNAMALVRLKDKLGNRSNASAEAQLDGALAWRIGEEGRGVATIIDMVTHCRLDCALASAALMRSAVAHALHHAEHRTANGRTLIEQPLMMHVLADLVLDVEAAVALSFRLARAFDRAKDPRAAAWRRIMTPVTKYWVTKVAPGVVGEAMECLGGNGYTEDWPLARHYREAPVNAIWEGTGNVMALDVLRVLQKEPDVAEIVTDELRGASQGEPRLKAAFQRLETMLTEPRLLDLRGRALVEALGVLAAATILRAAAPPAVAEAFISTRLGGTTRQTYGQGLEGTDLKAIVARASPNRR
ncbi:MAG: acyl-CoA dehydrogenase family protein [Hyphomicrobium sp.]|nr:acyl-CoA dehydrogenase family protein [Hyphomicrobium sp.]